MRVILGGRIAGQRGVSVRKVLLALCAVALVAPNAGAATKHVDVRDNFFDPKSVSAKVGDTVHWMNEGTQNGHSVLAKGALFTSGRDQTVFEFQRTMSAGTFLYRCRIHGTFTASGGLKGMGGTIKVPPSVVAAPAGPSSTVTWATSGSDTGTSYDVQYRVGGGSWKFWMKDTSSNKGVFGQSGKPVSAEPGTKYSFRVRSRKGSGASGWSPIASITS